MAGRTFIRLLTATAIAALRLGTAAVAHADPSGGTVISADLDGDHVADTVSAVQTPEGGWELKAELSSGGTRTAPLPDDDGIGRVGLLASDINADGRAEVVTPVYVGMNQNSYNIYVASGDTGATGLAPLRGQDGQPFRLLTGGYPHSSTGFGCTDDQGGRRLYTINGAAHSGPGGPLYDGHRISHSVVDGIVTAVSDEPFKDVPGGDPILKYDTVSCAPRS
jgi:hypothetical protein